MSLEQTIGSLILYGGDHPYTVDWCDRERTGRTWTDPMGGSLHRDWEGIQNQVLGCFRYPNIFRKRSTYSSLRGVHISLWLITP